MANERIPGPLGTSVGGGGKVGPGDSFEPPGAFHATPGPVREEGLTPEEQALAMDIAQLTLDIVGIFEPTPFADGTNALISIARNDWIGAGLSGISIIPYIGDLAKAGKLPGYVDKLNQAISLARRNPRFAAAVRPIFEKLQSLLDSIPGNLSPRLTAMVESLRGPLDAFLGGSLGVGRLDDIEAITDRLLMAKLGSTMNVGVKRDYVRAAAEYFREHAIPDEYMIRVLSGIDITKPIEVVTLTPGTVFLQYVDEASGVGDWWVRAGSGSGALDVGLATGQRKIVDGEKVVEKHGRQVKRFRVTKPVTVLKSTAARVVDTWSPGAISTGTEGIVRKPGQKLVFDSHGRIDVSSGSAQVMPDPLKNRYGVMTSGGGEQYYLAPMDQNGKYSRNRYKEFMSDFEPVLPTE